jgi:biopolymer transport protein ExbB/TolQ
VVSITDITELKNAEEKLRISENLYRTIFRTTGTATLATVAPGIAEALVATAAGLVAAIPAVIAYNYFLNRIRMVLNRMDSFSAEFVNFLQRKAERV